MKLLIQALIISGLIAFAQPAFSMLRLEPYGGYSAGIVLTDSTLHQTGVSTDKTVSSNDNSVGSAVGGKLGLGLGPISVGADYMYSSYDNGDLTTRALGPCARIDLLFFSLSATYFTSAKMMFTDGSADGTGVKAGIGLTFLPFISLNIEYLGFELTSARSDLRNAEYTAFNKKVNALLVGLSIPLGI